MMKKSKEVQLSFSPHILQKSQNKNGGSFQKKRHPELTFWRPESLTLVKKNIRVKVVSLTLNCFKFQHRWIVSIPISRKTVGTKGTKGETNVFEECSLHYQTNITVLGCICADCSIPPPMIYPLRRINSMMAKKFPFVYISKKV